MTHRISVLVSSRRNSKYLAKYIMGYLTHTEDFGNTELLVMASAQDEWNRDLFQYHGERGIRFFFEDYHLGRRGLHVYFNELAQHATGQWLLYMCEDHVFVQRQWDQCVRRVAHNYNPDLVYVLLPKFKFPVPGHMSHIVSRGYLNVAGRMGGHGNIDSWINVAVEAIPSDRKVLIPEELFDDLTHHPDPMKPEHTHVPFDGSREAEFPAWEQSIEACRSEGRKLADAIRSGR